MHICGSEQEGCISRALGDHIYSTYGSRIHIPCCGKCIDSGMHATVEVQIKVHRHELALLMIQGVRKVSSFLAAKLDC
jgi:hypothetical protein